MTVEERNALLERAWELQASHDVVSLARLLSPVPLQELLREPELGMMLAFSWIHAGNWESALDLVSQLEGTVGQGTRMSRRRDNLEAMIHMYQGRLARAESLWQDALMSANRDSDELLVAWASVNLGIVADIQCRWEEALSLYQRSCAASHRLGDRSGLWGAWHNMAMTYRQLGLYEKADSCSEHALAYIRTGGTEAEIGSHELERAVLLSQTGDVQLAEATARRALGRFDRIGNAGGVGDSLRVLGIIMARNDRRSEARRLFESGLEKVRSVGERLTEAEILGELAALELAERNPRAAGETAERAGEIYLELGAAVRAERLRARLRDMGLARRDDEAAPGAGPDGGLKILEGHAPAE